MATKHETCVTISECIGTQSSDQINLNCWKQLYLLSIPITPPLFSLSLSVALSLWLTLSPPLVPSPPPLSLSVVKRNLSPEKSEIRSDLLSTVQ